MGIELRVVEQDLDHGETFLPGLPPLRPVAVVQHGGMLDIPTRTIIGPSRNPIVWYAGPRQAELIQLRDLEVTRILCWSAEGGGKTVMAAQWLIWQIVLDVMLGLPGPRGKAVKNLATAPTGARLTMVFDAIKERVPIADAQGDAPAGAWGTHFIDKRKIVLPCGHIIQGLATKKASKAVGSPVQGHSTRRSLDDELQDTVENGADPDIEARLRGFEQTFRFATATAKDSSGWRTFKDQKLKQSSDWRPARIRFDQNPFEWPRRWEVMRRSMSEREWRRRGLAEDVGPERMTYHAWDRSVNLARLPDIGAEDVTAQVLAKYGAGRTLLAGHDPGQLWNVTVLLKAIRLRNERRHRWWVVGGLTTQRTTSEQHAADLLKLLRGRWHCNHVDRHGQPVGPQVLVRSDPYGETDKKPSRQVYTIFRQRGIDIRPAAYKAGTTKPGHIPKDARIEVVNMLLANADGEHWLFVDVDDRGAPVDERLVEALEVSERDERGDAETEKKDERDKSHWGSALGFALYMLERPKALQDVEVEAG